MNHLLEPPFRSPMSAMADSAQTARILYVEDDEPIRRLVKELLTRAGYFVTTVSDGMEGWSTLTSDRFDLVITDNNLPHMTGMELIARARMEGLMVPVIVASGFAELFMGAENEWLRVAALLQKPFGAEELLAAVKRVLRDASSPRAVVQASSLALREATTNSQSYRRWGINE